eukprot:SAG31_NODE_8709_length_1401_cov_1.407066_2_plen_318_part_01
MLDRSLVLGSVDRPSLHDIVRDYVQQLFGVDELRQSHRRLVDTLREQRPECGWQRSRKEPTARYIWNEIVFHIREGWDTTRWNQDRGALCWLDDKHHDAIPQAAARVLGSQRTQILAEQAERQGQWWPAALRWAAAGWAARSETSIELVDGVTTDLKCFKASAAAILRVSTESGECSEVDKDGLEYRVIMGILKKWNGIDLATYGHRLDRLMATDVAHKDVLGMAMFKIMSEHYPAVIRQDYIAAGESIEESFQIYKRGAAEETDEFTSTCYRLLACCCMIWSPYFAPAATDKSVAGEQALTCKVQVSVNVVKSVTVL